LILGMRGICANVEDGGFPQDWQSDMLTGYFILKAIKNGSKIRDTKEIMARQTITVMVFRIVVSAPFPVIRASQPGLFSCGIGGVHGFIGCMRLNSLQERAEKLRPIRRCYEQIMGATIQHIVP
jgi:hypothetical protein